MTNIAISQAAVATWAVPEIAVKRSMRYVAAVKVGRKVFEFKSVNAALRGMGLPAKSRGVRGAMMENGGATTLEFDGKKYQIALVLKEFAN